MDGRAALTLTMEAEDISERNTRPADRSGIIVLETQGPLLLINCVDNSSNQPARLTISVEAMHVLFSHWFLGYFYYYS
jgi:hypothetical protein